MVLQASRKGSFRGACKIQDLFSRPPRLADLLLQAREVEWSRHKVGACNNRGWQITMQIDYETNTYYLAALLKTAVPQLLNF